MITYLVDIIRQDRRHGDELGGGGGGDGVGYHIRGKVGGDMGPQW